jgi:hypothetical protein
VTSVEDTALVGLASGRLRYFLTKCSTNEIANNSRLLLQEESTAAGSKHWLWTTLPYIEFEKSWEGAVMYPYLQML